MAFGCCAGKTVLIHLILHSVFSVVDIVPLLVSFGGSSVCFVCACAFHVNLYFIYLEEITFVITFAVYLSFPPFQINLARGKRVPASSLIFVLSKPSFSTGDKIVMLSTSKPILNRLIGGGGVCY